MFPLAQARGTYKLSKEENPMKKIFGVPLSDGEEICEDTLHELGCGCPECCGHDYEEDGDKEE